MERCTNHSLTIFGSSNNPYIVSVKEDLPTCSCVAFAINKNRAKSTKPGHKPGSAWCKHLESQFHRLCRWQGDEDEQVIPGMCPRCSSPTEVIDDER